MKKIKRLQIDTSTMPTTVTARTLTVLGEVGAKFMINILQGGTINYYDFVSREFVSGHTNKDNNLIVVMTSARHQLDIIFPSGAGPFIIKLIALDDTEMSDGSKVASKTIEKSASDTTITFSPATSNTSNYATFPTSTSTGSPSGGTGVMSYDWTITNASTDSHGFGIRPTAGGNASIEVNDQYWYYTVTGTVDGAITSSNVVKLDSVAGLGVGTVITGVSAGSLSGTPSIVSINDGDSSITLSSSQTFADDITLTFKAYGSTNIETATGASLTFESIESAPTGFLEKTVRSGGSGTTVNLNGTYGLGGGNVASYYGYNVDNSGNNKVTSVSASSTAGSMVVQSSQSLTVGTKLLFFNSYQTLLIRQAGAGSTPSVTVNKYPTSNITIYLDIDQFISVNAAS